ncbi:MAG TPA: hypothetical protein GX011_06930 [Clostridiales bacterium]|jgi:uncharacterized membrane protein YebE (DUF533 family)|nr:hypothetical protein [Clostridiales bacterium]
MFNWNWCRRKPKEPNYTKIVLITLAAIAAAGAVAYAVYKLFGKYFKLEEKECEDFIEDGCEDCDVCYEDEADNTEADSPAE